MVTLEGWLQNLRGGYKILASILNMHNYIRNYHFSDKKDLKYHRISRILLIGMNAVKFWPT